LRHFVAAGLDTNFVLDCQMLSFDMNNRLETQLQVVNPISVRCHANWESNISATLEVWPPG
jgi:hypothetical protein